MTTGDGEGFQVSERGSSIRFAVRVQPRAAANAVAGVHGGALKVRLSAPPVDGAANASLVDQLSEWLGVSKRAVRVVAGEASRSKVVEVDGIDRARVLRLVTGH